MARYDARIPVPTAPQATLDYLARFSTTEQWDPGVVEASDLDGPTPHVGARYRVVAKAGATTELIYEIAELDDDHVVLIADGGRFRSHDTITCRPADGGGTEVHYVAELTLNGPARIFDPLLGLAFRRIGDRAVEGLRTTLAEGIPDPTPPMGSTEP